MQNILQSELTNEDIIEYLLTRSLINHVNTYGFVRPFGVSVREIAKASGLHFIEVHQSISKIDKSFIIMKNMTNKGIRIFDFNYSYMKSSVSDYDNFMLKYGSMLSESSMNLFQKKYNEETI